MWNVWLPHCLSSQECGSVGRIKKKVDDKREKGKEKTPEAWTLLTTQQVVCVCFLPMFLTLEISEQL